MWDALMDYFTRYPAQERVVRLLIKNGFRIADGRVWAGEVELADAALARAANVDRRIVASTISTIEASGQLAQIFQRFRPTLHLKDVAPLLNWGVIEIGAQDAAKPGIVSGVSAIIARQRISIRQCVVEDPDFTDTPKLYLITEKAIPAALLQEIQQVPGVRSVTIY